MNLQTDSALEVDVVLKEGLIEPNSTIILPVTIKTSVLGILEYDVRYSSSLVSSYLDSSKYYFVSVTCTLSSF